MKFSEVELPSNRKFGFFFTFVFAVAAAYFFYSVKMTWVYTFITSALIFMVVTLVKSDALLPLNKLWMHLGLFLNRIVSPLILGIIYFGLFTPIAMFMRISGRDELRLKTTKLPSLWKHRKDKNHFSPTFKNQF